MTEQDHLQNNLNNLEKKVQCAVQTIENLNKSLIRAQEQAETWQLAFEALADKIMSKVVER